MHPLVPFLVGQVAFIIFVLFTAHEEVQVIRMMRDYVPKPNPYNEPFHFYGGGASIVPGVLVMMCQNTWLTIALIPFICAMWYWLLFDYVINTEVFEKWDYVGYTSKIDKWLRRHWGNKAGKRKFWFSVAAIAVLNLIYFL
jgi:hypothetical protein